MIVDTKKKRAWLALLFLGAAVLSLSLWWRRAQLPLWLFSILAALASSLDLPFSPGGLGMVHLAVVTTFLTTGLGPAIQISLTSILLAGLLKRPWSTPSDRREPLLTVLLNGLWCSLALWVSGQAYLAFGTHDPVDGWSWPGLLPVVLLLSGYALIRHAFLMGWLRIKNEPIRHYYRYNAWLIVSLDLLLLPLAVGVAAVYLQIGPWDFVAFCGLLVGLSILLRRLGENRRRHLEKLVQELRIVYEMGQAVAANLELDKLLDTLYRQVSQLVDASNFYVALYDPVSDLLSFPIVFEGGEQKRYTSRRAGRGLCEWVIETKQPLLIRQDVSQTIKELDLEPIGRPAASWLGVPLIVGDDVLGVMVVQNFERPKAYDQEDQRALTMLASQAAIAVENARLYGRTQRRAAELALLNTFSTAVSATLDLDRVLQIAIGSVMPITGCQQAAIYLLQGSGQALYLVASRGFSQDYRAARRHGPLEDSVHAQVVQSRQIVTVPDVSADERLSDTLSQALKEGYRALAGAPLLAQDEVIGVLYVYYEEVHRFGLIERDLLMTVANQAAAALANARLYNLTDRALARRVEELSIIEQIGRELVSTLEPQRVIDLVLEEAVTATNATQGSIAMLDPKQKSMSLTALFGYDPEIIQAHLTQPLSLDVGIAGRVFRTGQVALVPDVSQDKDYWSLDSKVKSQLTAPISREGQIIGVVNLESTRLAGFDEQDASFVSQLAVQAAVALENAQLFQEAGRRVQELTQLYEAGLNLTSSLKLEDVLEVVSQTAQKVTRSDLVTFYLYEASTDTFTQVSAQGYRVLGSASSEIRERGLTRAILKSREPIRIADTQTYPDVNPLVVERGVRSLIGVPVVSRGQVMGVLFVNSRQPNAYTQEDERLVAALANQAAAVTANVRLFNQVRQAHDQLQAILNSTREGLIMLDNEGRIVMANKAVESFLGLRREDMVGQVFGQMVKAQHEKLSMVLGLRGDELDEWVRSLQTQPALEMVREFRSRGPQRRFSQVSSPVVVDQANTIIGRLLVFQDVSEEKELEEMRESLSSMIVHDLRSPLTSVLGGLKLIEEIALGEGADDMAVQAMKIAQRSCNSLLLLIDSLMDISQLETGSLPLEHAPAPLAPLVHKVAASLSPLAMERGVILKEAVPDLPLVAIDDDKIRRVFINLIDNALKFSPVGGEIIITAKQIDADGRELVQCTVSDQGPGIPNEFKEKIFDPFMQVRNPAYKGQQGSGLGLAFCKLAVEAHGGRIWIETPPDGGSRFHFTLPVAQIQDFEKE